MAGWTPEQLPDLQGRRVVVTGANSGLGLQTALELARHGGQVTMACRNAARGEQARVQLLGQVPEANVSVGVLDLADLQSVRAFAEGYLAEHDRLDVLVNNAGVMATPLRHTRDGFELQIGTNHLGHFALTGLLLPALLATPAARVVTVSSLAHRSGRLDTDSFAGGGRRYRSWGAYGQSKLANLLFCFELDRRARAAGVGIVSVAAHPGVAATNLQPTSAAMNPNRLSALASGLLTQLVAQSDAAGAWPTLFAAGAPAVAGGDFIGPDGIFELRGHPRKVAASRAARDPAAAQALWETSERLTGVIFQQLSDRGQPGLDT